MPRRRFLSYIILTTVALAVVLLLSSSSRKVASQAVDAVKIPESVQAKLPTIDDLPFSTSWSHAAHKPPEQKNSTSGDSAWYSDWRWLNPFSSSVTLDEQRAVLPPSLPRTIVYTYYDTTIKRSKAQKKVDQDLLLTWRRAWWAQGFRPIVLTQAEALANPLYRQLQMQNVSAQLETEVASWLAWEHMGKGLLASYLCVPMAAYEDPLLVHLRHGEFDRIARFDGLGSGLFAGEKYQITNALRSILSSPKLGEHNEITEIIDEQYFKIETSESIAYYNMATVSAKYTRLASLIKLEPVKGTEELIRLINAHLHDIWQDSFTDGIAVLKPLPAHTSMLIEPGAHLARLLAECPASMLPSSCPPGRSKCTPCVSSPLRVRFSESFKNVSSTFVVAVIPHPLTLISLNNQSMEVDASHIRRLPERDPWIRSSTRAILGDGRGGPSRVVALKDLIASERSRSRGLWFTVEHFPAGLMSPLVKPKAPTNDPKDEELNYVPFPEEWLEDLDWQLGFPIPREVKADVGTRSPIPGSNYDIESIETIKSSYQPAPPSYEAAQIEIDILEGSRKTINSKKSQLKLVRAAAEAWNLADAEIWKFTRAFRAKIIMERRQWQEEEAAYVGGTSSRRGRWW